MQILSHDAKQYAFPLEGDGAGAGTTERVGFVDAAATGRFSGDSAGAVRATGAGAASTKGVPGTGGKLRSLSGAGVKFAGAGAAEDEEPSDGDGDRRGGGGVMFSSGGGKGRGMGGPSRSPSARLPGADWELRSPRVSLLDGLRPLAGWRDCLCWHCSVFPCSVETANISRGATTTAPRRPAGPSRRPTTTAGPGRPGAAPAGRVTQRWHWVTPEMGGT
jgi:hypothetical protein